LPVAIKWNQVHRLVVAISNYFSGGLAGLFEALEGLPAAFGQTIVLGMLAVGGDAAATAHNILTHEMLYRLGFAIPSSRSASISCGSSSFINCSSL
jgi:hypothetical protein